MRDIEKMTKEELFELANIATDGNLKSERSREVKEVEVGGYGKRRRVIWINKPYETGASDEYNSFEITAEYGPWSWLCEVGLLEEHWIRESYWTIDNKVAYKVNSCNPSGIVDYCDENKLNIRNK
jgi:hypothetical protein